MSSEFSVQFFGCRGSIPVSGESFVRYGGATSCLVVKAGGHEIILDAGSGILNHGRELIKRYHETRAPITSHIFISHTHFDHLVGLPYFPPMFMADSTMYIRGPRSGGFKSFEASIEALVRSPYYPVCLHEMHSLKHFSDIGEADVVYFLKDSAEPVQLRPRHPSHAHLLPAPENIAAEVHCMRGFNHPKSGVNIYKVVCGDCSLVYATDTEGFVHGDRRLIQYAQGADVLIHDAMYTEAHYTAMPVPTQGYGHSTVEIATSLARDCGAKRLYLFHHDPTSTDDDLDKVAELGRSFFADTHVAGDGLKVII